MKFDPACVNALQRVADSLQVLVLLLPFADGRTDPRSLLLGAAARQALQDIGVLRDELVKRGQRPSTAARD